VTKPPEAIETAIRQLKTFTLLDGFRGLPKGDLPAAVAAIAAVADRAAAHRPTLLELDVNPLLVLAECAGVVAVDALIVKSVSRSASGEEAPSLPDIDVAT
jgi:hypothetical protein